MAHLKKENLVKDGKYNKAEIMKRAWAYVKNPFNTQYRGNFKWALERAWLDAKGVMEDLNTPEPTYTFNPNIRPSDLRPSGRANNFMYGY